MNQRLTACVVVILLVVTAGSFAAELAPNLTPLTEHSWGVQVLAFSPDGKFLFSGCEQGLIRMTEVSSGETRHLLKAHPAMQKRIGFLALDDINVMKIAPERLSARLREPPVGVVALAVSRDGSTLYSGGGDRRLLAWDTKTGKEIALAEDLQVAALALSPDGKTLAATGYHSDLRLLDTAGKKEPRRLRGGPERITTALFSPDGKTLYTGGVTANTTIPNMAIIESDTIRPWDVATGREGPSLRVKAHRLAATSDGHTFVAIGALLRAEKGPLAHGQIGHDATSLDTQYVTQVWDSREDKRPSGLPAYGLAAVPSPDGKVLVTATGVDHFLEVGIRGGNAMTHSYPSRLKVCGWDISNGQLLFELPVQGATVVAFSPDGKRLAIGTAKGKVLLSDMEALKKHYRKPRTPEELWAALAEIPLEECSGSMWALAKGGNRTVKWLERKLFVPTDLDLRSIQRLIADLDDDDFEKREAASAALDKVGPPVYRFVQDALDNKPKPEPARRLRKLLEKYADEEVRLAPELRRCLRAVALLEEIDTQEARDMLKKAAAGEANLPIQEQAKEALKRLEDAHRDK